ncbi:unnamed protein product, partial [Allacma fusca]
MTQNWCSV